MNKSGRGFITFAQNTEQVDYLKLAYVQCMNVKLTQNNSKFAVIVDKSTKDRITDEHRNTFDYIVELPYDENEQNSSWKLGNEYQVFSLTPFKETVKLESDLLFTRSIEHWWSAFRLRDVFLSTGCKNYRQEISNNRSYRKFFDDNELPDVYNGLMYFRYSQLASEFFLTAREIYKNWEYIKTHLLKNCREDKPSTDVLYALTAKVVGSDRCTVPSMNFVNFVHMKNQINQFGGDNQAWTEIVMHERDCDMIRINNLNQYDPVHYFDKNYITDDILNDYRERYSRSKLA